jgi:chitodextrinase
VPASPSLSVKSPTEIDISWQPSTDNVGVVGYYIYQNGSEVAAVSSTPTSYANTNLSPSTVYLFSVAAFDAAGNTSNQSYAVQATTPAPDLTAPTAPRFLYANPISSSEIDLTWQASTDNVGVAGYYIDRDGVQVGTATGTAYADLGLTTSTLHAYTVQAYDAAGNISAPASVSATTLATGPATPVTAPTTPVYNPPPTTPTAPTLSFFFTTTLYYGLRSSDVTNLQTVLIQDDYLGPNYATGFFGSLTQKAVQQYQCAKAIVCYGNPQTTGWGLVGKRTRAALNAGS